MDELGGKTNCFVDVRAKEEALKSLEKDTVKLTGPLPALIVELGGESHVTHALHDITKFDNNNKMRRVSG